MFGALQHGDSLLHVALVHLHFAEDQDVVYTIGIGIDYLGQQTSSFVGVAHPQVGLRHARLRVWRARFHLQDVLISLQRLVILAGQAGGVTQVQPQACVLRSSVGSSLGVYKRQAWVAALHRILSGAVFSSHFEAGAEAKSTLRR